MARRGEIRSERVTAIVRLLGKRQADDGGRLKSVSAPSQKKNKKK